MTLAPRVVVVHRRTEREQIVREQGTWEQAKFQAKRHKSSIALSAVAARFDASERALQTVSNAIPSAWRRGAVEREDLDRFLFEPEDLVVVVGQDGLVANVAKYLTTQPVIGIDPTPGNGLGVLTRHQATACAHLLQTVADHRANEERRTMAEAVVDDRSTGLTLTALNEIYLGSPTHQSARYELTLPDGRSEAQSSSGLLAGTGTGATGWLRSVAKERRTDLNLPTPEARGLGWFVREAWPSPTTGADLTEGVIEGDQALTVLVRSDSLVIFGDGMEADRIQLAWGQTVTITPASRTLRLVV